MLRNVKLLIIIVLLGFCHKMEAQFYSVGDDPGRIRWSSIESPSYKIIYPEGLDSLAKVYGTELEKYRIPVSGSAGYVPGELMSRKMPVILHAYNAMSNGSVAWAPVRMDLFTSPEGYGAEAMPWVKMLAIHESRHAAQIQFGRDNVFKPFYWLTGEMFAGAMSGLYPSKWMLEGDAVVAETALTDAGRGRSADFLNYYMAAFDNGDFRNWNRWRYGSFRYWTPDHYALGYMTISGIRYVSGSPDFMGDYLEYVSRRPYDVFSYSTITRKYTGKDFRNAFRSTIQLYHDIWTEEKAARAPFIDAEQISRQRKEYTRYSDLAAVSDTLYAIRQSMGKSSALVMILPSGKERILTSSGSLSSPLWHSEGSRQIWWSEYIDDERWSQETHSVIRCYDLDRKRKSTFVSGGKKFCPSVSSDGMMLTAIDYPVKGGSGIEIYDMASGHRDIYISMPDSIQATEAVIAYGRLYICGISERGYGLYSLEMKKADTGSGFPDLETVLGPQPVKIRRLRPHDGSLYFTSDKNGVNELYRLDPGKGDLFQVTSTEYGATDFCFSPDGSQLYYVALRHDGKPVKAISADSLEERQTSFSEIHRYRIADELSRQEKALAEARRCLNTGQDRDADSSALQESGIIFSKPERYRKFDHLFNIHSWAPVYFNADRIMDVSYDYGYEMASLGAAALIQNNLGTMTANFGYSAHRNPYHWNKWKHSGHVEFTYTGLYPVIEASVDFNDRSALDYSFNDYIGNMIMMSMTSIESSRPYVRGKISAYIPFNFSSGGWSRGVIPQVSYSISNDIYHTGRNFYNIVSASGSSTGWLSYSSSENGKKIPAQTISASARAYVIRNSATSEIYPDWGIGIETGISLNAGLAKWFSPVAYMYAYGYLPGITHSQGLRLTALYQKQLLDDAIFDTGITSTLPRGLSERADLRDQILRYGYSAKLTADYAIPIYLGDFSISPAFYGKRAILTPHFDYTFFKGGNLFSAGATLEIEFGCFFWIGTPINIGLTWSYNGGKSFDRFRSRGIDLNHHYIGPVVTFELP